MNENNNSDINYEFWESKEELLHTAEEILDKLDHLSDNNNLNHFDENFEVDCNFNLFNKNLNGLCRIVNKDSNIENNENNENEKTPNKNKNESDIIQYIQTSPSKFNNIPTMTSASTNFACESSFLSHEDIFITNSSFSSCKLNSHLMINPLTSDKIVFIKNQLKNEVANFSGFQIGNEGAKKISDLLLSQQFSVSHSKRNQIIKVKELKFTKSGIGDEGFSYLSNCLEKSNNIHSINFNKNNLKDESYTNILNLIKNNKQLKFLNLASNLFTQNIKEKIKSISKNLNANLKIEI